MIRVLVLSTNYLVVKLVLDFLGTLATVTDGYDLVTGRSDHYVLWPTQNHDLVVVEFESLKVPHVDTYFVDESAVANNQGVIILREYDEEEDPDDETSGDLYLRINSQGGPYTSEDPTCQNPPWRQVVQREGLKKALQEFQEWYVSRSMGIHEPSSP